MDFLIYFYYFVLLAIIFSFLLKISITFCCVCWFFFTTFRLSYKHIFKVYCIFCYYLLFVWIFILWLILIYLSRFSVSKQGFFLLVPAIAIFGVYCYFYMICFITNMVFGLFNTFFWVFWNHREAWVYLNT